MAKVYDFWVVVWPSQQLPGQWLAHILELDQITQGNSIAHAFEMAEDAAGIIVDDDLNKGRDPLDRRAPKDDWGFLDTIVTYGHQTTIAKAEEQRISANQILVVAAQIRLAFELRTKEIETRIPFAFSREMAANEIRA